MEFNDNQVSQNVRDTIARLPQFETEVGQTVTRIDGDISARATKATDFVSAITSTNKGATQVELTALENSINQRISDLNYIQFVTELPETGEEKYIYAVVQDLYDREGHQIVVLYIWKNNAWYMTGALSVNFDPNDYLLKTEAVATYLPLAGGTLTGNLTLSNLKSLVVNGGSVDIYESTGNKHVALSVGSDTNELWLNFATRLIIGNYEGSGSHSRVLAEADKAVANGVASLDANTKVPVAQLPDLSGTYLTVSTASSTYLTQTDASSTYLSKTDAQSTYIPLDQKAVASGIASLDANTKVPVAQLPIDTTLSQTSTNLLDNATITNALMQAADTISRGVYEKCDGSSSTSGSTITISLEDTKTIYKIKPLVDSTIVFDTTALSNPANCWTTFYVIIDFSDGKVDLTWPSNVIWGNISPSGTANVRYMYSFMIPDDDNVIIGNEMQSWVRQ